MGQRTLGRNRETLRSSFTGPAAPRTLAGLGGVTIVLAGGAMTRVDGGDPAATTGDKAPCCFILVAFTNPT